MTNLATAKNSNIQARFEDFHKKNPHVYNRLVELTREWKASGNKKIGIGMLFEIMRWEKGLTTDNVRFKLSNDFRSRYARLIQVNEPDISTMFNLRELREVGL